MADVTLENRHLRTVVDPDQGCGLLAFAARRGSDWLPLLPDVHLGLSELRAASFLMVPYSNRIENGRFTFQGRAYQLEGAERHAIHGDVRGRPWQTEERTPVR
ncbi:MAG: aldose 1-epimerase, partial [Gemmatimonadota bacterium]